MGVLDFVEWLDSELKERNLSRAEFAKRGKIAAPQVTRVLKREQNPGIKFLIATARAFKIPRSTVFKIARIDDMKSDPSDELDERADHLIKNYKSRETKEKALEYLEFLALQEEKAEYNVSKQKKSASQKAD